MDLTHDAGFDHALDLRRAPEALHRRRARAAWLAGDVAALAAFLGVVLAGRF